MLEHPTICLPLTTLFHLIPTCIKAPLNMTFSINSPPLPPRVISPNIILWTHIHNSQKLIHSFLSIVPPSRSRSIDPDRYGKSLLRSSLFPFVNVLSFQDCPVRIDRCRCGALLLILVRSWSHLICHVQRGMTIAPRVQVYTQLSCNTLHGQQNDGPFGDIHPPHVSSPSTFGSEHPVPIPVHFLHFSNPRQDDGAHGPPQLVSQGCLSDPAVQAGAARLQAVMITVMGVLSACTTSWWGHYGQKHGRNKVLAASTIGLLLTYSHLFIPISPTLTSFHSDLTFVLASTPSSPFSRYGGKFLFLAPVIEGILGGHVTQQAAVSAYISDCTSDGSRAHIFSRLAGVSHVGIALGPTLGAFLIRHSLLHVQSLGLHHREGQTVTAVFWAAILCCAINFLLILLVIPESLEKARLRAAQKEDSPVVLNKPTLKKRLLGPLAIFVPRKRLINGHLQKDWSMSWLATAVFALLLANVRNLSTL
jgi:MFS family permease